MIYEFINQHKSLVLSSLDEQNLPFTSYAPYLLHDEHFYIFISDIAKHARNLQRDQHCSIFFIESEEEAQSLFARKRVVLQSVSTKIEKENAIYNSVMPKFEEKFGATIKRLKQMKDFNLYQIKPIKGEAVFGFGEAYDVACSNKLELVERANQKGHSK